MKRLLLVSVVVGCFLFVGCQPVDDGVVVDPNAINVGVEAAITLAGVLGLIWPPLIPVATAVGGLWAGYRRLKPKLKEAEQQSDKYYAAGETLAEVLDDVKKNEPEVWAKIGPRIRKAAEIRVATPVENTLREFRGLEPIPEIVPPIARARW